MKAILPNDVSLREPLMVMGVVTTQRAVDHAGEAYELYLRRRMGLVPQAGESDEDEDKAEDDENVNKDKLKHKKKKINKDQAMKNLIFKNHYHALGLESEYFGATEAEIRKQYKIKVLNHHPDKYPEGGYDEIAKQQWLAIQDAYETLIDPEKKRRYDSTMEFDESLPANKDYTEEEFFETFPGVFARNAVFSEKKPIPNIGDMKTAISRVLKFYEFWETFQTWRDFKMEDEYDCEQAENRYERRYMERENKRMKKDLLKKEKARIKKLVDLAKSKDPRIIKFEKEEEEKAFRQKEEKRLEKQRKKDEEDRIKREREENERLRIEKEQEEARKKEEEIKAKKDQKKSRTDQMKLLIKQNVGLPEYGEVFFDYFFPSCTEQDYEEVVAMLSKENTREGYIQDFKDWVTSIKERLSQSGQKKQPVQPKEQKMAELSKWTEEELAMLSKGLLKWQVGTGSRWEKITDLIGGTKNIYQVTAMAKELSVKNMRGEKNLAATMEEVLKEKNQVSQPALAKDDTSSAAEWTQPQQKALEAAMKLYPASMEKKERWSKISEAVAGKSPKECIDRVKEIKEKLASKKQEATK
jgi:DnaJ family protein C protein 2